MEFIEESAWFDHWTLFGHVNYLNISPSSTLSSVRVNNIFPDCATSWLLSFQDKARFSFTLVVCKCNAVVCRFLIIVVRELYEMMYTVFDLISEHALISGHPSFFINFFFFLILLLFFLFFLNYFKWLSWRQYKFTIYRPDGHTCPAVEGPLIRS